MAGSITVKDVGPVTAGEPAPLPNRKGAEAVTEQQERAVSAILLIGMICMLLIIVWTPLLVEAGPFMFIQTSTASESSLAGQFEFSQAYIELQFSPAQANLWAAVQRQTSAGVWQTVENWQGPLNAAGLAREQVEAGDFGAGPFRWAVLAKPNGTILATSQPFTLPTLPNETIHVLIELDRQLPMAH